MPDMVNATEKFRSLPPDVKGGTNTSPPPPRRFRRNTEDVWWKLKMRRLPWFERPFVTAEQCCFSILELKLNMILLEL